MHNITLYLVSCSPHTYRCKVAGGAKGPQAGVICSQELHRHRHRHLRLAPRDKGHHPTQARRVAEPSLLAGQGARVADGAGAQLPASWHRDAVVVGGRVGVGRVGGLRGGGELERECGPVRRAERLCSKAGADRRKEGAEETMAAAALQSPIQAGGEACLT